MRNVLCVCVGFFLPKYHDIRWTVFSRLNAVFHDHDVGHRNEPLELERELFLAGCLVLGARDHVVEEEQVTQFSVAIRQFDDERILHESSLSSIVTLQGAKYC